MQAGRLRHRIIIQKRILVENEIGETVEEWADYAEVWASVEPASGTQYYAAKQLTSKVDGKTIMRYRSDIEPTMRIIHDGRILRIVSLFTVRERKRELNIMYSEALD